MYKIAICDDTQPLRRMLKEFVEVSLGMDEEYEVDEYSCGEEIIEATHKKYDVIFMDVDMGKLNGFDTARIIRKDIDKEASIVFLTAHPQFLYGDWQEYGNGYLEKPIFLDDFTEILRKVLKLGEK